MVSGVAKKHLMLMKRGSVTGWDSLGYERVKLMDDKVQV